MTAGGPMDGTGVGGSVGAGDRGEPDLDPERGGGTHDFPTAASPSGTPEHEPGPATTHGSPPPPAAQAPNDPAPDLRRISSGDGPGQSPGE